MHLPATQSIPFSATDTHINFLLGFNTSYVGSVRICMPMYAKYIAGNTATRAASFTFVA